MRTIVVAGTCSGVGKTAIAVGLMAAYTRRGLRVQPFKIGPDFLDPMHHHAATGRHSYNLDAWMLSREANLACFKARVGDTDVAIVEGVMGLYDGRDGKSDAGSTAEMAKLLSAPVLLVLDCWTLARSAAAIIRGYTTFDPALQFAGVVFNKVGSPAHTAWLTDAVQTTEPGIQVLGGLPKTAGIDLPQRHLGFQTGDDDSLAFNSIQQLADLVEHHLDLDAVFASAALCDPGIGTDIELLVEEATTTIPSSPSAAGKPVRIGVARDEAFCFYYQANLNLLEDAGAEVVYFSPLRDSLPPRLDAIIFGGGHPELYVAQLAANKPLLYAVRAFALAGGIVYGECGGLMYLSYGIEGTDGELFLMCGVFPFATRIQPVTYEGYVKVTPRNACVLFPAIIGEIRGQIYRSSEIFYPATNQVTDCPKGLTMKIDNAEAREELEGFMQGNAMATVVHLHFGSNSTVAPAFVDRCRTNTTTKAAAVAAASASAVVGAGPAAAAAAGAAAAAAVAAALGPPVPYHRSSVTLTELESFERVPQPAFSDAAAAAAVSMRRSESVGDFRSPRKATLLRSGSEVWGRGGESVNVTPETNGKSYYSGAPVVRVTASSLQGNRKVDMDDGDGAELARPRGNGMTYDLDVHRQQLTSRVGKVLNGNRWPERIVSLLPGATEILLEIGAGARLIAITDMCDRPRGVKARRHVVCSSKVDVASMSSKNVDFALKSLVAKKESHCRLDVQWLSKAKPDLIISQDICEQCEMHDNTLTSMLAKSGVVSKNITRLVTFSPKTVDWDAWDSIFHGLQSFLRVIQQETWIYEDMQHFLVNNILVTEMLASIMRLGEAVNLYSEACLLLNSLRARLRRVAAAVAAQDQPRVLLLQGLDPLQVGGHWAFEMVTLAGGSEALQKPGCPPETLHAQRLSAYAPEVLVLAPRWSNLDRSLAEIEIVGRIPGFWSIPAVERREVYICDHSCFSFPGPRLVEGVELLAHILHPLVVSQGLQIRETVLKLSLPTGQRCRPEDLTHHFHPLQ